MSDTDETLQEVMVKRKYLDEILQTNVDVMLTVFFGKIEKLEKALVRAERLRGAVLKCWNYLFYIKERFDK